MTTSYDAISQHACQLPQRRPGARRDSPAAGQRRRRAAATSAAAPDPRTGSRPRGAGPWLPGTRSRRCPGRQCQTLCRVRRERGAVMSGPTAQVVHLPRGTWPAEIQRARASPPPPPGPARSPPTGPGPAQNLASPGLRSCSGTCLASQRPRVSEDLPGPSTRSVSRHFLRCDMPAKRGGGCGGGAQRVGIERRVSARGGSAHPRDAAALAPPTRRAPTPGLHPHRCDSQSHWG